MLWNAKMRFGKTLTALQVVKKCGFEKTIIFTHRPVVSDGWFEDFQKIFYDRDDYIFGSRQKGKGIELKDLQRSGKNMYTLHRLRIWEVLQLSEEVLTRMLRCSKMIGT